MSNVKEFPTFEAFVRATYSDKPFTSPHDREMVAIGRAMALPFNEGLEGSKNYVEDFVVHDLDDGVEKPRALQDVLSFYKNKGYFITGVNEQFGSVSMTKNGQRYGAIVSVEYGVTPDRRNLRFSLKPRL